MRTAALIRLLAADPLPGRGPRAALLAGLPLATMAVAALALRWLGLRPDLPSVLAQGTILVKNGFPWLIAAGGLGAALAVSRPGERIAGWLLLPVAAAVLVSAAMVVTALALPPAGWGRAARGHSLVVCLTAIPTMALPILAVTLAVLRRGAAVRPWVAGFFAGLASGGAAAGAYAFHCTDDSPLFWAIWYVVAILAVAGIGAVAGNRLLRW